MSVALKYKEIIAKNVRKIMQYLSVCIIKDRRVKMVDVGVWTIA